MIETFANFPLLSSLSALALAIWLVLFFAWGGFWRMSQRLQVRGEKQRVLPKVIALVPARNEATVIAESLTSLLNQDYDGPFKVLLIDDHSADGTSDVARSTARRLGKEDRLTIRQAAPLPPGWAGKLWALNDGYRLLKESGDQPRYLWLSDADISHSPETLKALVTKAEVDDRELVSLMALLKTGGFWGRLLIPPFIYFFQKLYPFSWAANPKRRLAAAAGGCVLIKRDAFEDAGGLEAIRGALIDDCTLAALIKHRPGGNRRIWLGLTETTRSLRPYGGLEEIWAMVARSAYTQLKHSNILLSLALIGLAMTYLLPPLLLLAGFLVGDLWVVASGLITWILMAISMQPVLRLYRQNPFWGILLPLAALLYGAMTFSSAWRHWRGRGGTWKGRQQAGLEAKGSGK